MDKYDQMVSSYYQREPISESSGGQAFSMTPQGYLDKREKQILKNPKGLQDIDINKYHRSVLTNRAAEPTITDDEPKNRQVMRQRIMNLYEHGQPSKWEPRLNEVCLQDNSADPRGTENIPNMGKLREMTYQKQRWIKANLHQDGASCQQVGDQKSQFQEVQDRMKLRADMKKRLIVFETEKQTTNKRQFNNQTDPTSMWGKNETDQQMPDQLQGFQKTALIQGNPNNTQLVSQSEPDHQIPVGGSEQLYYSTYKNAQNNTLGSQCFYADKKDEINCNTPQLKQFLTLHYTTPVSKELLSNPLFAYQGDSGMGSHLSNQLYRNKAMNDDFSKATQNQQKDQEAIAEFLKSNQTQLIMQGLDPYQAKLQTVRDVCDITGCGERLLRNVKVAPQTQSDIFQLVVIEDFLERALKSQSLKPMKQDQLPNFNQEYEQIISLLTDKYFQSGKQLEKPLYQQSQVGWQQGQQQGVQSLTGMNKQQIHKRVQDLLLSSQFTPQFLEEFGASHHTQAMSSMNRNPVESLSNMREHLQTFHQNQDAPIFNQQRNAMYTNMQAKEPNTAKRNTFMNVDTQLSDKTINQNHVRAQRDINLVRQYVDYDDNGSELTQNSKRTY